MILILDVETTFTDGDNTPYNLNNKLVSVGINSKYFFFYHQTIDESTHQETFNKIQSSLMFEDKSHNHKYLENHM